jgi:hypothetical protein
MQKAPAVRLSTVGLQGTAVSSGFACHMVFVEFVLIQEGYKNRNDYCTTCENDVSNTQVTDDIGDDTVDDEAPCGNEALDREYN